MRCLEVIGLLALVLGVCAAKQAEERFDQFKVYKIELQNEHNLVDLKKLANDMPIIILDELNLAKQSFDVVVPPESRVNFEEMLKKYGIIFKCVVENLMDVLKERLPGIIHPEMEWTQYHSLQDIYDWLDHIVLRNHFVVRPYIIGKSYEGRAIKAVKISRGSNKKAIFVESNIHAVEWISSAASTCFLNNLLTSQDPEVARLTEDYDWIFVPVLNPDGFEYTHNVHPLWRKNRKPTGFSNSSGICYGTDMNRNFDYNWNGAGYNSDVPCDHWYGGAKPDSEPEVQALQRFVNKFDDGYIRMYLALHSYGNYLLLPYGHTNTEYPPNYDQMMSISKGFADAARVKYDTEFLYGASGTLNYPVSGSAKDWAYGVKNIPYTATIELRDKGKYGFFLPAAQIVEVCAEITDGFVGLIKAAEDEKLFD